MDFSIEYAFFMYILPLPYGMAILHPALLCPLARTSPNKRRVAKASCIAKVANIFNPNNMLSQN